MIRIVLAGIGIAALLFGCESKADRQNRTEPESHLLRKSQSPLLVDYKEISGRQIRDVSPDGKFILVGRDDAPYECIENNEDLLRMDKLLKTESNSGKPQ